jgi:hypothetical protein
MIPVKALPPTQPHNELASEALALERQFSANRYSGSSRCPAILRTAGDLPVIISAPHAVNHPREGGLKLADTFTGSLSLQLSKRIGAPAVIYSRTSGEDANYDEDGSYKRALAESVVASHAKFVVDLHGLGRSQPFELVIGTARGQSINDNLRWRRAFTNLLFKSGFTRVGIDIPGYYDAARPTTITSFIRRTTGVPALQLEIHKDFRDPRAMPDNYVRLLDALAEAILFCSRGL